MIPQIVCLIWDFLNYGYAPPDVFHSSVRKAVVCWQVDLHGQDLTWQCWDYCLGRSNPKHICVSQAPARAPSSVCDSSCISFPPGCMQSATSHPRYSHQLSGIYSICKMKESPGLLSVLQYGRVKGIEYEKVVYHLMNTNNPDKHTCL